MIAITGATGRLGRIVTAKLSRNPGADDIVAIARDLGKAGDLGVPVRQADYSDTTAWADALAGVDKLLLISGSEVGARARQHGNVIAAAKEANVRLLVYTSILHADVSPISLAEEHRVTEAAIKASGLPFVILRNSWYTENYTGSIPAAIAAGELTGCAGTGLISAATREDFADAAVTVLTQGDHAGRTYELAGDAAFTLTELADEVSRQTGKSIIYKNLTEMEYAAVLEETGLPPHVATAIAGWETGAAAGALHDDSGTLGKLIGRPTTPLSKAVSRSLEV